MSDQPAPAPAPQPAPSVDPGSIFTTENIRKWTTALAAVSAMILAAVNNLSPPVTPVEKPTGSWIVLDDSGRIKAPELEKLAGSLKPGVYHVRYIPLEAEPFIDRTVTISDEESQEN
jgi:hypothetical protein